MGANYETWTHPDVTPAELRAAFAAEQARLRAMRGGGPYQGHLGLLPGLTFASRPEEPFASAAAAEDFVLDERASGLRKRGPAVAVRYLRPDRAVGWYVGGLCPSWKGERKG